MVEMSDALCFLFSEQVDFSFFLFFPSPHRIEGCCFIHLVFQAGPKWLMTSCRVHCALCGKEESDEPATDAQDHVGGSNFALCRGTKNTWQHVHRSKRRKKLKKIKIHWMVLGYASVWSLIIMDHHRHVFHLINKTSKVSSQTVTTQQNVSARVSTLFIVLDSST